VKTPLGICAVSGGRADYGLLVSPLRAIKVDPEFSLSLVLTGQHLERNRADGLARVRADGFDIAAEVEIGLGNDDDTIAVTRAAGRVLAGMANVLARLEPDFVLLPGDRYEILCCAIAATIARVPIAHIAGGDITEGSFDNSFRHAISKMAHLHFVTNEDSARRLRQLGETAKNIFVVGNPGLDLIRMTKLLPREAFFAAVGLSPRKANIVSTFHPMTLTGDSVTQLDEMLAALDTLEDATILFTGANADPQGRAIDGRLRHFVDGRTERRLTASLGAELYFSALEHMDVIVGNSSSGVYEAPSFGIPTVNIGDRQKGRLRASSVFDCPPQRDAIHAAIAAALQRGRKPTFNPYGAGHASEKIAAALKSFPGPHHLLVKKFTDLVVA
jgi:UDP-hydrolysing UDP-N-acetyl-D-glucosamine 2-epimerase